MTGQRSAPDVDDVRRATQGFARVINQLGDTGEVRIEAVEDTGVSYGPLALSIDSHQTVHFNQNDLESGKAGKGLTGSNGVGEDDCRLTLRNDLDLGVLSYIRTTDCFSDAIHDVAPGWDTPHHAALFNPGTNPSQVSLLQACEQRRHGSRGDHHRHRRPGDIAVKVRQVKTKSLT